MKTGHLARAGRHSAGGEICRPSTDPPNADCRPSKVLKTTFLSHIVPPRTGGREGGGAEAEGALVESPNFRMSPSYVRVRTNDHRRRHACRALSPILRSLPSLVVRHSSLSQTPSRSWPASARAGFAASGVAEKSAATATRDVFS